MSITLAEMLVKIGVQADTFGKGLLDVESRLDAFGDRMTRAGIALSAGITAPLAGIAAASISAFSGFEAAMNKVSALGEIFGADLDRLKQKAMDLGASTVFTSREAAQGMGVLAAAGMKTHDIMAMIGPVMHLAAAGEMSVADAGQAAMDIMKQFGLTSSDMLHIVNLLAKANSAGSISVQDLAQTFSYAGSNASLAGVSLEELAAATVLMGEAGLRGDRGGTSLRMGLQRLAGPPKQAAAALDFLGVRTKDLTTGKMMPLLDILNQLKAGFAFRKLGPADQLEMLNKIFGAEAGPGWAALLKQGTSALGELTGKLRKTSTEAQDQSDLLMQGLPGALEKAKGAIDTLFTGIGKAIAPAAIQVAGLMETLAGGAVKVAEAFARLPMPIQATTLGLLALAAAVGPALYLIGGMASGMSALIGASKGIATAVGAFAHVGSALMGVPMALTKTEMLIAGFLRGIGTMGTSIATTLGTAASAVHGFFASLGAAISGAGFLGGGAILVGLIGQIALLANGVMMFADNWDHVTAVTSAAVTDISNIVSRLPQAIALMAKAWLAPFASAWTEFSNWFMNQTGLLGPAIAFVFTGAAQVIGKTLGGLAEFIKTLFGGIWNFMRSFWENMVHSTNYFAQKLKGIMPETAKAMQAFSDSLKGTGVSAAGGKDDGGVFDKIFAGWGKGWEQFKGSLEKLKQGLGGIKDGADGVKGGLDGAAESMRLMTLQEMVAEEVHRRSQSGLQLLVKTLADATYGHGAYTEKVKLAAIEMDALTKAAREYDALTLSGKREIQMVEVDQAKARKGTVLETQDILGDKSSAVLRQRANEAAAAYERVLELQRQGKATARDVQTAYEQWTQAEMAAAGMVQERGKQASQAWKDMHREIQQAFSAIASGLADSIVNWKGFWDTLKNTAKTFAKGMLEIMFQQLLNPLQSAIEGALFGKNGKGGLFGGLFSGLGERLGGLFGGGKNSGKIPGLGPEFAIPFGKTGGAGGIFSGLAGAANPVGMITGAASAISSIIGNFQQAKMETTLNAIEHETRYGQIHLLHLLGNANQYLPKLQDIHQFLIGPMLDTLREIRTAVKNLFTLNIGLADDSPDTSRLIGSLVERAQHFDSTATDRLSDIGYQLAQMSAGVQSWLQHVRDAVVHSGQLIMGMIHAQTAKQPSLWERMLGLFRGGSGIIGGITGGLGNAAGGVIGGIGKAIGGLFGGEKPEERMERTTAGMLNQLVAFQEQSFNTYLPELKNIHDRFTEYIGFFGSLMGTTEEIRDILKNGVIKVGGSLVSPNTEPVAVGVETVATPAESAAAEVIPPAAVNNVVQAAEPAITSITEPVVSTAAGALFQASTLKAIEKETRYGQIHLLNILENSNKYWPFMEQIHARLQEYIGFFGSLMSTTEDGSMQMAPAFAGADLPVRTWQPLVVAALVADDANMDTFATRLMEALRRHGVGI